MKAEREVLDQHVLYKHGRDTVLTDSELRVKGKWYSLSGITGHDIAILEPLRLPGVLTLFIGALLAIVGTARLFPSDWLNGLQFFGVAADANRLVLFSGSLFVICGALWLWFMHERYAIAINTDDGNKYMLVSRDKDDAARILHALNEALFARIANRNVPLPQRDRMTVSHR